MIPILILILFIYLYWKGWKKENKYKIRIVKREFKAWRYRNGFF